MAGVIFDLDGTLLDSVADIGASVNQVLEESGLATHPLAAYYDFVGEGVEVLLTRAMAPLALDPRILARYKQVYPQRMLDNTRPYPGVLNALQALAARGWRLAVLSNKPHEATQALVGQFFGALPWTAVAGNRPSWPRKPDPAAALDLCRQLGETPQTCWFVGDTAVDLQTAAHAGMRSIGVLWGFRPLEARGASVVAADSDALLAALLGPRWREKA